MRKLLLILGTVAALPFIGIVLLIGRGLALQMVGYPVDVPPSELAQTIAAENGDPTRCRKLQQTMPTMGPSLAEKRRLCIFTYAKLAHDPSACELLMPSEYGLSCINEVAAQEYKDHMDAGFFEWEECSKPQSDPLRLDWCDLLRAHRNRSAADCSPIRNEVIRAGCTLKFEAWEKYPELRNSFYFGKAAK